MEKDFGKTIRRQTYQIMDISQKTDIIDNFSYVALVIPLRKFAIDLGTRYNPYDTEYDEEETERKATELCRPRIIYYFELANNLDDFNMSASDLGIVYDANKICLIPDLKRIGYHVDDTFLKYIDRVSTREFR